MDREYVREFVGSCILIAVLMIAFAVFTVKVNEKISRETNTETKSQVVTVYVTSSYYESGNGNGCYLVIVRDSNGNDWAYYDSEYVPKGTELEAIMTDGRIVDISERR